MRAVSRNHHSVAPPKKPAIISTLIKIDAISVEPLCDATPNMAKKASRYGIMVTKLAIVKPNIDEKSRQGVFDTVPSGLTFCDGFCK